MSGNQYAEELKKERASIKNKNPFNKSKPKNTVKKISGTIIKKPYYEPTEKSSGYFNLILDSDYRDIELDIRGLKYVSYKDENGKEIVELERRNNHYLSEDGAEDLLIEMKGHLSPDIKLGLLTINEFLLIQNIIRKTFIKYIRNNLERLGMDTEEKQRKARPLIVMILNRIRSVYSRSIAGTENKRSHGDISLTGGLDLEKANKFNLEDAKN